MGGQSRRMTLCDGMYSMIAKCIVPVRKYMSKAGCGVIGGKQNGDVGLVGDNLSSINYQITDSQGNELGSRAGGGERPGRL